MIHKKVTAQWLGYLLHIQDILGSNLDPDTGYHKIFRGFTYSFQANSGIVEGHNQLPSIYSPIHYSLGRIHREATSNRQQAIGEK
jgi:hypothetical protein